MAQLLFKGQQLGKFEVLDALGTGGFAAVYLARDQWINKLVALKIPHYQNYELEHLLKEARLLARLSHPNIVAIYSAEQASELFFIVMEYVDGESLESLLEREQIVPHKLACRYIQQICEAVGYAHGQQILHRDLRPANVMIAKNGVIKVGDFGVAALMERVPYAKTIIGTPPYMSPEHFQGKAVYASDVYSISVMLYEMVTGTLPYYDINPAKIEQLIQEGNASPPRVVNKDVPRELSNIIMVALSKDLEKRYRSCEEFARALQSFSQVTPEQKEMAQIKDRITSRIDTPAAKCWNCGRQMPRFTKSCPKCHQAQ